MRMANGLGLGLAIVQRIARVLHHPLSLRSSPGAVAFSVTVPGRSGACCAQVAPCTRALPVKSPVRVMHREPAVLQGMRTQQS